MGLLLLIMGFLTLAGGALVEIAKRGQTTAGATAELSYVFVKKGMGFHS